MSKKKLESKFLKNSQPLQLQKKKKKSERERERCSTEDAESVTDHFEEEGRLDINHGPNHHQAEARNRDGIIPEEILPVGIKEN